MVDGLGVRAPWLMGTPEQSTFPPAVTVTTVYSNNKINKTNKQQTKDLTVQSRYSLK